MLFEHFKFVAVNNVGEQIDASEISIGYELVKGDGSGGQTVTEAASISNGSAITNGASGDIGTGTASGNLGLQGWAQVDLATGTAPDGDVEIYLEMSTDEGAIYFRPPTPIAIVSFTGTAESKSTVFSV